MRLAFLGSPAFAVRVLDALVDAGHDVVIVVTRPDRPKGRGRALAPTAVREVADVRGITTAVELSALKAVDYDVGVVVAYGELVPAEILERAPLLNVHFSLLPRWRGAAPVERAILEGDETTGVSIMALEVALDTGPVYATAATPVDDKSLTALRDELVDLGASLLVRLLAGGVDALPEPVPQSGEPTYARKVSDAECELDFTRDAVQLARVVRIGRARTWAAGRRLGVPDAVAVDGEFGAPGSFDGTVVACGRGGLALRVVVPEGRRAMAPDAWLRGLRDGPPSRLGPPAAP